MHTGVGIFISNVHEPGQDPQLNLRRDLATVELADELNYDEAWFGEHHSAGWGTIGAPETMVAAAAERTEQIKLANGVVPMAWHHPFHVASRAVHLDHLTRGRYILGVGPGVPTDAKMFGIGVADQRVRLSEALPSVIELVNGDRRVSDKTDWYELHDAKLQLPRYSPGGIEIAIASGGTSRSGPELVGRYGTSLVSFAMPQPGGSAAVDLAGQWQVAQESAAEHGNILDRAAWRVALPIHVAESRTQAFADVQAGFDRWLRLYWEYALGRDTTIPGVPKGEELRYRIESGGALVGSVDDVVEQIEALQERTGGFGCVLNYVLDWAPRDATERSLDLLARYVAPKVNGAANRVQESIDFTIAQRELARTSS